MHCFAQKNDRMRLKPARLVKICDTKNIQLLSVKWFTIISLVTDYCIMQQYILDTSYIAVFCSYPVSVWRIKTDQASSQNERSIFLLFKK